MHDTYNKMKDGIKEDAHDAHVTGLDGGNNMIRERTQAGANKRHFDKQHADMQQQ